MWLCSKENINKEKCKGCLYLIEYTQEKGYECMLLLEPNKEPFIYEGQQLLSEIL